MATMAKAMPTVFAILLSTIVARSAFVVSFSETTPRTITITPKGRTDCWFETETRTAAARKRNSCFRHRHRHRHHCKSKRNDDQPENDTDGDSNRLDSVPALEQIKTSEDISSSSSSNTLSMVSSKEAAVDNNAQPESVDGIISDDEMESKTNITERTKTTTTAASQSLQSQSLEHTNTNTTRITIAEIIDAFVSIKEKAYRIVRLLVSDLVTIIRRSATKARDWAVEDDTGQLVSSSLALVAFFAFVAAFAAWNIEVLSGGKSKWSGPKNGITVPVVKGLPATGTITTTTKFQKPQWKAPKIQTSYNKNKNNSREEKDEPMGGNEGGPARKSSKSTTPPLLLILIGLFSLFPTARSFGSTPAIAVSVRRTTPTPQQLGILRFLPVQSNHGRQRSSTINNYYCYHGIDRTPRRHTSLGSNGAGGSNGHGGRNSSRNRRGRWLPSDVLFVSTSLFRDTFRKILSTTATTTRKDDSLQRVRAFRHLPLRRACLAIGIYLSAGVLAYTVLFPEASWSVVDALYFSCVCLSTIGYGDLVPSTSSGKVFAALFGMSGILLWSSFIASVGTRLVQLETTTANATLRAQRKNAVVDFYDQHMPDLLKLKQPREVDDEGVVDTNSTIPEGGAISSSGTGKVDWPLAAKSPPGQHQEQQRGEGPQWIALVRSLVRPLLVIVSGGIFIGRLEGWNLCDSFYYSLVTATTIGFGDYSPSTRAGRMVAITLIPVLLASAGDFFARLGVFVIRNRTRTMFSSQEERAEWLTAEQAHEMDLDGSGRVSRSEYVLYMLMETGIVGRDECVVLEEQFQRFDVTSSGYIESGDLKAMKKFREQKQKRERTNERATNHTNTNQEAPERA